MQCSVCLCVYHFSPSPSLVTSPINPITPTPPSTTAAPRKAPPTVPATRPRLPASTDNHVTVVGYYFCGEPIPYRSTVSTPKGVNAITLAQFKQLITKRGHYR